MPMSIPELYEIFKMHPVVSTDSRAITQGCLFFALKGASFDGNSFAEKALADGAAYAIIDNVSFKKDERYLVVQDVLTSLQDLANHLRRHLNCPVLGITGTNGKTTTKELVAAVLSKKFKTHFTKGNLNNHIGVPLTILTAPREIQMLIVEMGANHQKEIEALCKIAEPTHGLITNVGKAHLEGFGGYEGVKKAKGELYEFLAKHNATVFINNENKSLMGMLSKVNPPLLNDHVVVYDGTATPQYKSNLAGDYNFENINAAIAIGKYFGVEDALIKEAIELYVPSMNRSQIIERGTNTIIMDAYNANPTSMEAALKNLVNLQSYGKSKVALLGEMAELGEATEEEHQALINRINQMPLQRVILVGKSFDTLENNHHVFANSEEAIAHVKELHIQNSIILIKGSRSARMEKLLEAF